MARLDKKVRSAENEIQDLHAELGKERDIRVKLETKCSKYMNDLDEARKKKEKYHHRLEKETKRITILQGEKIQLEAQNQEMAAEI